MCIKEGERIRTWEEGHIEEATEKQKILCFFADVLMQDTPSTEVMMFLYRAAEFKDMPILTTYSQTDLDDKCILFASGKYMGNV